MSTLPSPLIEASNGVLLSLFVWMAIFALFYLHWKRKQFNSFWHFHRDAIVRTAIAGSVLTLGLILRIFILWLNRHMDANHYDTSYLVIVAPLLFLAGNVITIIGAICWIRETLPLRMPRWVWLLIVTTSLIFGIGMAWN